ncbi:DUF4179 domain-containing protein [Clostridium bornimense]|uniref:DUF4179 domain-containing protein n=1 Tax=Clostridium bornimense TaxID=1216932 RepID=UPI001C0F9FC3|nr:DUF4179 domain-containing protein [Clostridium bornimense]MBU5315393.1 DUF4179 domain-containing protein [Clostridium bornimense]
MDNKLKNELSKIKDNIELPDSYKFKFKKTLDTLPSNVKRNSFKFCSLKVSVAVALISTLTIGSVVFGEDVKVIKDNVISFFNGKPTTTVGLKDKIESISTPVNISDEHDGVKFTLENMSIDDNFLICSFTIDLASKDLLFDPTSGYLNYMPDISYIINGKRSYSTPNTGAETDSYKESETKIKLIQRVSLANYSIEDKGDIEINFYNNCYKNDEEIYWSIKTSYDKTKSKAYTRNVPIDKDIRFNTSYSDEVPPTNMKIKNVCFSPLGNQIVIESCNSNFILMDDKNNYLETIAQYHDYDGDKSIMSIEFLTPSTDISSLKLIPVCQTDTDVPHITPLYDLDNMPSSIDLGDKKIIIEDVSTKDGKINLKYHYDGYHVFDYVETSIYDENGTQLGDRNDHGYGYRIFDRNSNSYITTHGFYTDANFQKAKKISFYMDSPIEIKYDEAYTIDLNK